jgi:RNAse (barnase) inhibitor barstar
VKAIIIEEKEFAEFSELYTAKSSELKLRKPYEMAENALWDAAVNEAFRQFNYYFVNWAHRQGASMMSQ